MAPGEERVVTATKTYTEVGSYTHYATVFAEDEFNRCACTGAEITVSVCPDGGPPAEEADLSVVKSGSPDPVLAGATLNFSIAVKNKSTFWPAEDVVLEDTIGPGLTLALAPDGTVIPGSVLVLGAPVPPAAITYDEDTRTLRVEFGPNAPILPGHTFTVIYQVTVDDIDPQTANALSEPVDATSDPILRDRVNTVTVTSSTDDPDDENNTDVNYTGVRNYGIGVEKSVTPEWMYAPGGVFTYTFDIWNSGNDTMTIDSMTDDVLGDLMDELRTELGLMESESVELLVDERIELTVMRTHSAIGTYPNTVTIVASNAIAETVTVTDSASARVIPRLVDLSIKKRALVEQVRPGDTFTYELIASNETTISAFNTIVTDTLGSGLSFVPGSVTVVGTTLMSPPTISGNVLSIPLGTLAPFQSVMISYQVTALPGSRPAAGGTYSNSVVIGGDDTDPNPDNDDEVTDIAPGPRRDADVTVEKTASPESRPSPGGEFTYTFKVWNSSDETITIESLYDDVLGELPLPAKTMLIPGEYLETVVVTAEHKRVGTYKNTVVVTAVDDGGEPVEDTDSASVRVTLDLLPRTGTDALIWLVISGLIAVVAISLRKRPSRNQISG